MSIGPPFRPLLRPLLGHLPLVLVAAMLAIAVALEGALFGRALLASKAPLAALLALAFWRSRGVAAAR